MEKETKKYLIIGTALVVSVGIGVALWKKYQSSSSATTAASDQSNQDELALLLASLESNAYAGQAGAASYSPAVVGTSTPTSLADEITALETALGFGPPIPKGTASPVSSPTTPPTTSSAAPNPSAPSTAGSSMPEPITPPHVSVSQMIKYNHGSPLFEMDGVTGEEVQIS